MKRFYAWVLPVYALAITFLVFFQGWPGHQQSAAEPQRIAPCAEAVCKAAPAPAETAAANHAGYPIPAPAKQPKHLFHLVFRYEGDGLIDQNAVDACKSCGLMPASAEETKKPADKPAPAKSAGSNLFHFIVRYEGEGIVDNNVVDLVKAYMAAANNQQDDDEKSDEKPTSATPAAPKAGNGPPPLPAATTTPPKEGNGPY